MDIKSSVSIWKTGPLSKRWADNVVNTQRETILGKGDVTVGTVEHGLAALYGLEIDNCLIEVNAPEFPNLDGSAIEYVKAIKEAGIIDQERDKDYYVVRKKIEVADPETGGRNSLFFPTIVCVFIPSSNSIRNIYPTSRLRWKD